MDDVYVLGSYNGVFGGNGADLITTIGSHDTVKGGSGKDVLTATGYDNKVKGGSGKDSVYNSKDYYTMTSLYNSNPYSI